MSVDINGVPEDFGGDDDDVQGSALLHFDDLPP
jgi:hypothetical protein